jgi:hypothetical protein
MFAGGGSLGIGLVVGLMMDRGTFTRQVKDKEFDPEAEVISEEFFEEAWEGEKVEEVGDFPTDAQLEALHRHSTY